MQAEIDPARRDEVDTAELAALDQRADRLDGRAVDEGMTRHEEKSPCPRRFQQLERLARGRGQRLFDKHMLVRFEGAHSQLEMSRNRSCNRDRLHFRIAEHRPVCVDCADRRVAARDRLECGVARVADVADIGGRQLMEVADEVRPPITQTDDSDYDRRRTSVATVAGGRHVVAFPAST